MGITASSSRSHRPTASSFRQPPPGTCLRHQTLATTASQWPQSAKAWHDHARTAIRRCAPRAGATLLPWLFLPCPFLRSHLAAYRGHVAIAPSQHALHAAAVTSGHCAAHAHFGSGLPLYASSNQLPLRFGQFYQYHYIDIFAQCVHKSRSIINLIANSTLLQNQQYVISMPQIQLIYT